MTEKRCSIGVWHGKELPALRRCRGLLAVCRLKAVLGKLHINIYKMHLNRLI